MRQFFNAEPFDKVFARQSMPLWGRWLGLKDGDKIATPAKRASGASLLSLSAAAALIRLLEGTDKLCFVSAADPAMYIVATTDGDEETILYRTRNEQVINTTPVSQSPTTAALFAARLISNRVPDLSAAYGATLAAYAAGADNAVLLPLLATAADELVVAVTEDIDQDSMVWFYSANVQDGDTEELDDAGAVDLRPLFTDPAVFGAFQKGEPTDFTVLDKLPGAVGVDGVADTAGGPLDPHGFFGKQLDTTVKFMKEGRHILHHGPTGTGKSFVWELAMHSLDEAFDADNYPYFVHGSAGLEDIDFTGNYVLGVDGSRRWVDGPLVRAMKDGKRFKVEELNRLPGAMLNVLLGAMDYGRISLPRYDGQIVVKKPGFAVDAMANIGREYTATEEIDPAIMRRFTIKIEYDFLKPDDELLLLRSRYPALKREDGETLVRIAGSIRQAYEEGNGTVDVDLYVSPAALLNTAGLIAGGEAGMEEAIELTFLTDVAWTKSKRESVRNLVQLHLRDRGKGRKRTSKTK
jgi:MoxR-like ATPase